jgi:hypothetical protein
MYSFAIRTHGTWKILVLGNTRCILGRIRKDRVMEIKKWASKVKRTLKEEGGGRKSINLAIVSANNHYAGFGQAVTQFL